MSHIVHVTGSKKCLPFSNVCWGYQSAQDATEQMAKLLGLAARDQPTPRYNDCTEPHTHLVTDLMILHPGAGSP